MTAARVRAAAAQVRASRGLIQFDIREALADLLERMADQLAVAERLGIDADEMALPEYTALTALVEKIEEALR